MSSNDALRVPDPLLPRLLAACGSFLVAVVWMDLIFDVQVVGHSGAELPEPVVRSIATYYARATTDAYPMGHLVGLTMLVTVGGALYQLARGSDALAQRIAAALTAGVPIALALARVFPNAVELGQRTGSLAEQSELARAIFREHVLCIALMTVFVTLQLRSGRRTE